MKKPNKYLNKKVEYDGILFDSHKEKNRYIVLRQAEKDGIISHLELQPQYELIPKITEKYVKHLKTKDKICERTVQLAITYRGDFRYKKDGVVVVEDVKASPNHASMDKTFIIKEKLFRYEFGFPIRRVYKATESI